MSKIDWCEINYQVSNYICEFMNSISSFAYIYLALFGAYNLPNIKYKNNYNSDHNSDYNSDHNINHYKLYNYYLKIYYIYFVLGIFTLEFHFTLSLFGQVCDEVSIMILLTILNLDTKITNKEIIDISSTSGLMILYPDMNIYIIITIAVIRWLQLFKVIYYNNIESLHLFIVATFYNALAVFFWGIDIGLCNNLYISTHFIWHIFSALAIHYYIIYSLLYTIHRIPNLYNYKMVYYYFIPYIDYHICTII